MKQDITREIELPEGFSAELKEDTLTIKGNSKELTNVFALNRVEVVVEGNKIKIMAKKATKRESKIIGTVWAHIKNMIKGLKEDFVYKLEICNVHFPMNVKTENDQVIIKSFLGEKTDRKARILPTANVEIKGSQITVTSSNIEAAGQTAANIEKAAKLTGRDRRIFQDGIFITEKNGRLI